MKQIIILAPFSLYEKIKQETIKREKEGRKDCYITNIVNEAIVKYLGD